MSPAQVIQKNKIFTLFTLLFVLFIDILYICFATYLQNYRLVNTTILGSFSFTYKTTLLYELAAGIFIAFGVIDSIFLVANGLLVGLNLVLIFKTIRTIKGMGKVKLSVGGATLIGLVAAGCGACGFTIFSLLGVSASLSFLPFHGLEIHVLSFAVLLFSSLYMMRKLLQAQICRLY